MSTPGDAAPEPGTAPPEKRDRLRRNIALTLASLVVLGAGLAILQVDARGYESTTARETTKTAVRAMSAAVAADTAAGLEPDLQSERDFLPFRRPLTVGASSLAAAAGEQTPAAAGSGSLRVARAAVPDLAAGGVLPRLQTEAQRLQLQQRALAVTRITWNNRATQYTTVIAVLAVALFLVGFGLVVEGPVRRASYLLGLGIGVFVACWGAWVYHLPIPSTPAATIDATARGAALTADGDYRAAVARYDAALAADDGYATAYAGRARARLLAANPDYPLTRAVTSAGAAMAGAVGDARRAIDLDDRDILATSLVALTSFYRGEEAAAGRASDEAIAINPKVPELWLLKSATEIARGDRSAASSSLERGLSLLRGTAATQRTRLLASTYLSNLAWVQRHVPAHARLARELADRIVAIETRFTLGRALPKAPPARGTASVEGLRFADGRLTLRLRWSGLPAGTALSGIGYERPLERGAWTQPAALAFFATVAGTGARDISVPLERVCKPTSVRVDLYLNGAPDGRFVGPGVAATC